MLMNKTKEDSTIILAKQIQDLRDMKKENDQLTS